MTVRILKGDCRELLRSLPAESVHCVVTSPPYWGLRDYGVAGQIGLEGSFAGYVEIMRNVFGEVRRVLRSDGTLWLNLGDSYAANGVSGLNVSKSSDTFHGGNCDTRLRNVKQVPAGLKPKDLCGIPWRVAFALQADGWYLRSDIIWSKPNPMPESVTDRPTKAHEYLFLLAKSERYFYDAEAIKEEATPGSHTTTEKSFGTQAAGAVVRPSGNQIPGSTFSWGDTRNRRSVWEIATSPFPEAHFATFPPSLVEPCIKAGTSEKGCCAKCGAPWVRKVEYEEAVGRTINDGNGYVLPKASGNIDKLTRYRANSGFTPNFHRPSKTIGFSPSCSCKAAVVPATCLDPFFGAGTTGLVADRLGRDCIGIELNPQYAEMAERRLRNDGGMFAEVSA